MCYRLTHISSVENVPKRVSREFILYDYVDDDDVPSYENLDLRDPGFLKHI